MVIGPRLQSGALSTRGCLFCRRHDGGFLSPEHVYPEAIANVDELVLPPGVVCDRCNHGPLARADRSLVDFPVVQMLRAERGIPTKKGKPVQAQFRDATLYWTGPGDLTVESKKERGPVMRDLGGGRFTTGELKSTSPVKDATFRNIAHAVWKMAIEWLYVLLGPAAGFDPVFDPVRHAILGTGDRTGWLLTRVTAWPHDHIQLTARPEIIRGHKCLPTFFSVFGFDLWTDPLRRHIPRERISPPFEANVWIF